MRKYRIRIFLNDRWFDEIWIDPYYEIKHKETITDELIIELVKSLSGQIFEPVADDGHGWQYFKTQPIYHKNRPYRLIWLTHRKEIYVGIRNAFRIKWRQR